MDLYLRLYHHYHLHFLQLADFLDVDIGREDEREVSEVRQVCARRWRCLRGRVGIGYCSWVGATQDVLAASWHPPTFQYYPPGLQLDNKTPAGAKHLLNLNRLQSRHQWIT